MRVFIYFSLTCLFSLFVSTAAFSQKEIMKMSENRDSSSVVIKELNLGYYFDTFNEPYRRFWSIYSAGTRLELPFAPIFPGVNIGRMNRGSIPELITTDLQLVVESYPKLTPKIYSYLMYGYSHGRYFPTHRAEVTVWLSLENGWVIAGGTNYYLFDKAIIIPHIAVEKYISNYWLAGRINLHNKPTGLTSSLYLTARRYFNDTNYLQITAGTGTAPDEPYDILSDLERQKAFSLRLLYNRAVADDFMIKAGAGYSLEDYGQPEKRNRFEGLITVSYKINNLK